jgi:hypothetical protein
LDNVSKIKHREDSISISPGTGMVSYFVYDAIHLILLNNRLQFVVPPMDQRFIETLLIPVAANWIDCAPADTEAF